MINQRIVAEIIKLDREFKDHLRAEGLSEEQVFMRHLAMVGVMKLLLSHGMPIREDSIQTLRDIAMFLELYHEVATKEKK